MFNGVCGSESVRKDKQVYSFLSRCSFDGEVVKQTTFCNLAQHYLLESAFEQQELVEGDDSVLFVLHITSL
jgi:hypothetical protein